MANDDRIQHLVRFYSILDVLEKNVGGARKLAECSGRMNWPRKGVYFFRESGENRSDTGVAPRIVRVGTHALKAGSNTMLWTRLSQHKGQRNTGGGNHRGSIFRLIIGSSLIRKHEYAYSSWGEGSTAGGDVRMKEQPLEHEVSKIIGSMSVLCLSIEDEAGPESVRGYIERNVIALLSNYRKLPIDPASGAWLGHHCDRERVRCSGLWNSNHVEENCDPAFLEILGRLVSKTGGDAT
jgi:hypothetical protein